MIFIKQSKSIMGFLYCFLFVVAGAMPSYAQTASALKGHDTAQAMDYESEDLRLKHKKGQAFLIGSVKVVQGDLTLNAAQIVFFYDIDKGFDDPVVHRLDATGGVKLITPSETISSEWGVYDVDNRIVTLGGNVSFEGDGAEISGDRLELNLLTGLVKLDGKETEGERRVKGRFSVPDAKEN